MNARTAENLSKPASLNKKLVCCRWPDVGSRSSGATSCRLTLFAAPGRGGESSPRGRAATGLPLRLLEIGASAGLNLRWDHFPFLDVPVTIRVAERRGCDLNPMDPTLDESRAALLCFVWPDQTERLQLLAELIETVPPHHRISVSIDGILFDACSLGSNAE